MRAHLVVLVLCLANSIFSQKENLLKRNFIGTQVGGQMYLAWTYECSVLSNKNLRLNTCVGPGVNRQADDDVPGIYCVQYGISGLAGKKWFYFEAGITPVSYFYNRSRFNNINCWLGFRIIHDVNFISFGYTPVVYKSPEMPADRYRKSFVGVKGGFNF
jgi:hypothetical protein